MKPFRAIADLFRREVDALVAHHDPNIQEWGEAPAIKEALATFGPSMLEAAQADGTLERIAEQQEIETSIREAADSLAADLMAILFQRPPAPAKVPRSTLIPDNSPASRGLDQTFGRKSLAPFAENLKIFHPVPPHDPTENYIIFKREDPEE